MQECGFACIGLLDRDAWRKGMKVNQLLPTWLSRNSIIKDLDIDLTLYNDNLENCFGDELPPDQEKNFVLIKSLLR